MSAHAITSAAPILQKSNTMPLPIHEIIAEVACLTGVPAPAITGPRRADRICFARFLTVAAIRQAYPRFSLRDIAECVGRTDHGTTINALRRFSDLCHTDRHFRANAQALNLTTP